MIEQSSNIIPLFPTPIGVFSNQEILPNVKDLFVQCKDYMTPSVDNIDTTIGVYSPGKCVNEVDLRNYQGGVLLESFIINSVKRYLNQCGYEDYDVIVENMWLNSMPNGTTSPNHFHYGYAFSGVYYTQCTENNNKIHFEDPMQFLFYQRPIIREFTTFNSNSWWINIKEGDLVVFPSFLRHGVPHNNELQHRHSIAFDVSLLFTDTSLMIKNQKNK